MLADFLARDMDDRVTLGELVELFGDRAFGMLLLILAIPNVVPVPGLSTVVGIPTILLGLQMAIGWRQPWLPKRIRAAGFERESFQGMIRKVQPVIERVERRLRPRLSAFTEPPAERVLGLVIALLGGVLCLPIVFGNLPPAIAIALMALGLIEKDGAFVIAGLVACVAALAIVGAILFGLGEAAMFVFRHALGL
jgi:hypothetical protein